VLNRRRTISSGFGSRSSPALASISFAVPESSLNVLSGSITGPPLVAAANPPSRIGNPSQTWKILALSSLRQFSFFAGTDAFAPSPSIAIGGATNNNDQVEDAVARKEAQLSDLLMRSPERVTTEDFLTVLRALAASRLPDAAVRSDRWLHRLEQHTGIVTTDVRLDRGGPAVPNAECYQRVIEAWSTAVSEDPSRVVTRAERWLWKHIDSPSESLQPNTACFNAFLDACTKGRSYRGSKTSSLQRMHAEKAEAALNFMIDCAESDGPDSRMAPNTESFNSVMRGWTRDRRNYKITECTSRIFSMLENYQARFGNNVRPDCKTYNMLMDSIAVRAKLKVKRCRPQSVASQEPQCNGLEEIGLLRKMLPFLHSQQKEGNLHLAPTTVAYNALLSCWANISKLHDDATSEAEAILRHMTTLSDQGNIGARPDSTSYMLVLRTWVNSSKTTRGQRVEWLLSKQWNDFDFSGDENLRPTVDAYNLVIRVWADLKKPLHAEKVLTELINLSADEKSGGVRPTSESFALMIRAWILLSVNGNEQALKRAAEWLQTLVKREKDDPKIVSSVDLFSSILGAARKCASHAPEVLDLSVEVFEQLRSSHHVVEPLHYSRLIQIGLLTLSKADQTEVRNSFVRQLVEECKEAGLVGSPLLQALANGPVYSDGWTIDASDELVWELFPDWPLPPSWTRNVKQTDLLPQKHDLMRSRNIYNLSKHGVDPYQNISK